MLLASLSACKKTNDNNLEIEIDEVPKVEISVSSLNNTPNSTDQEDDATYSFLGYGYDITDKYASAGSVRGRVIDMPLFVANNSNAFVRLNSTMGFSMTVNGISAKDFSSKLSEKYDASNGLNVFKSTLVGSFPENDALSKKYGYGYFSDIFIRRLLRIQRLKGINSLTATFTEDVKTLTAEQLVKKYGTHILIGIQIGSRINAIYQSEVPDNSERKLAVSEGFHYAIKKVIGLFTGNLDPLNVKALNTNSAVKLKYEVIGGDPRKIKEFDLAGITRVDINDWLKSDTEANYKFIDFEKDGVIPLHDLITDSAKKAAVKEFVTKYILENQVAN